MKILISDACLFLDLFELNLFLELLELDVEIHAAAEVVNELGLEHIVLINELSNQRKINIHHFDGSDWDAISKRDYPNTICYNDKIALHLAEKLNCLLLSSDKVIRQVAKRNSIDYHGLLWIFDRLIEGKKISIHEAILKLEFLSKDSKLHQQNTSFVNDMNKRIVFWETSSIALSTPEK